MAVDGYLNFDTAINTKGFVKGVKDITKKFVGSAAEMKAAFDTVTSSFERVTAAYRTQIESEARLGATMKNSTSATAAQIDSVKKLAGELQELGVVGDEVQLAGAQELATYVGNAESIKKMLPVLNDMIAQQYGYSASTDSAVTIATMLGKVLQGQTSALSRYGYSFDEAQEKLLKYGTEEQRVATLAAVVEESVAGVNNALADTPTGKVKQLENDFGDLKETAGQLLTEIVYPLVVKLDVVVKKINEIFSAASSGVKSIFGVSDDISVGGANDSTAELDDSSAEAADNFADIAESAKEAEKANKGSLAAFDELNVLAQDTADTTAESTADIVPETAAAEIPVGLDTSGFEEKVDGFVEMIKEKWERLKKLTQPLKVSFDGLKKSLAPFKDKVGEGLEWFWKKILKPLGKWTLEKGLPSFVDMMSGFFTLVDKVGSKVVDALKETWDNFFGKIAAAAGDKAVGLLDGLAQFFRDVADNQTAVTTLAVIAEIITTIIMAVKLIQGVPAFIALLSNPMAWVVVAIAAIIAVIIELITYWDTLKDGAVMAFDAIKERWEFFLTAFRDTWTRSIKSITDSAVRIKNKVRNGFAALAAAFKDTWDRSVKSVTDSAERVWEKLKSGGRAAWSGIKTTFSKVAQFFGDTFSNAWAKVKAVFSKGGAIFTGIKDGIVETFKEIVNSLIDAINDVVRVPFEGINSALGSIKNFELAGKYPFEWLPTINIPELPHLAQGTVIPANYGEFAAILGDNKREREFVAPESALEEAFLRALARAGITGGSRDDGDNVINIDGREVFRAVKRQADSYKRTHGVPAFG